MNRKFLLGYSIVHASSLDLDRILKSVWSHLDTDIILVFDGREQPNYLECENLHVLKHDREMFEHHCNNTMINYFMNETDKDALIVLHEDMLINGFSLFSDLDKLLSTESNIGFIGGRDGFEWGYDQMYSSPFSKSIYHHLLDIGQYQKVPIVNFGPVVYTRELVTKIGKMDAESYTYAYADQDYSFRASSVELDNYVIGMDIVHEKFGNIAQGTPWYSKEGEKIIARDLANLRKRWGR